jgi:hypothetical protein
MSFWVRSSGGTSFSFLSSSVIGPFGCNFKFRFGRSFGRQYIFGLRCFCRCRKKKCQSMSFWVRSSGAPLSAFFLAASLALSAAILNFRFGRSFGRQYIFGLRCFCRCRKQYQSMGFRVIKDISKHELFGYYHDRISYRLLPFSGCCFGRRSSRRRVDHIDRRF